MFCSQMECNTLLHISFLNILPHIENIETLK